MFMFHATQGRTKPINTFYDNGCSDAVFLEGIPGEQLRGQVVMKGPFTIGGIGGLQTVANDEWVVSVLRADGKKQLIQGLTVERITSDFPQINLETAVREVKEDDPNNTILQNCTVPPLAGGCVEMLVGIKYNSIFPKEIHTLPCGLTIYQSRLASHGGQYNACIGGPHSSFTAMADSAGGVTQLIVHFVDGLKAFRESGPGRISSIRMTEEEVSFAKKYNADEGELLEFEEIAAEEELEELAESEESISAEEDLAETDEELTDQIFSCCDHCVTNVSAEERVSDFKKYQEMHDSGLEIEYRCPKCRECLECKSADKTEKISLKEESEMFEIRKSIKLDFENKKIQSSLPLRGKERDYLSNNKDRALKVLNQQCKKYFNDTQNKPGILEAFDKLFRNGHAKLLSQLSEDELNQFIHKEVQHHFIWRVVFSGSLTTPYRPVMDASSRTAFRKDGSGGKCLNDLVCKGKIESLNLLKVLLRFMTGLFAMTGDLQQFYNACKLLCEQWNLQRFLWVKDLDPDGEVLEAVMLTLIYGVSSVSAQSELAMQDLADYIRKENPELAALLVLSRYVDDLQESKSSQEECFKLANVLMSYLRE